MRRVVHPGARYFNSRPSARGDPKEGKGMSGFVISIHAPPRGATAQAFALLAAVLQFQFTPLREGRRRRRCTPQSPRYFNSRPSARGDCPCSSHTAHSVRYFNSRPSARGDRLCTSHKRQLFYFNSRPSARGDDTPAPRPGSRAISIHAPPRGATPTSSHSSLGINFNSRPSARGDTQGVCDWQRQRQISIHAPPRGATHASPDSPHD